MEKAIKYLTNRYGVVVVKQNGSAIELTCKGHVFAKTEMEAIMEFDNILTFVVQSNLIENCLTISIFLKNENAN